MVIIVGSGAGGAILAMELAKSNVPVTIIEKGKYIDSKDAFNYYDKYDDIVNNVSVEISLYSLSYKGNSHLHI